MLWDSFQFKLPERASTPPKRETLPAQPSSEQENIPPPLGPFKKTIMAPFMSKGFTIGGLKTTAPKTPPVTSSVPQTTKPAGASSPFKLNKDSDSEDENVQHPPAFYLYRLQMHLHGQTHYHFIHYHMLHMEEID